MEREKSSEVMATFRRYAQAFQALDARAVAHHFNEPAFSITPRGVVPLPSGAAVEHHYRGLMAELPAMGYARTEFSQLREERLNDDLAVVTGTGVWKKASGEDLIQFGVMYTMRRVQESWRIVIAVVYEGRLT